MNNRMSLDANAGETVPWGTPALMRLPDVLRRIPVSKSTYWAGARAGHFPRPRHIGRIAVWSKEDVDAFVMSIIAEVP